MWLRIRMLSLLLPAVWISQSCSKWLAWIQPSLVNRETWFPLRWEATSSHLMSSKKKWRGSCSLCQTAWSRLSKSMDALSWSCETPKSAMWRNSWTIWSRGSTWKACSWSVSALKTRIISGKKNRLSFTVCAMKVKMWSHRSAQKRQSSRLTLTIWSCSLLDSRKTRVEWRDKAYKDLACLPFTTL